ncbi:MAG: nucleoside triphosphate pyrophosphohydrolase [Gammaproteobacteria bacterium]|nr:nucleoside triphosphate pyrophosphohydrolase [Gammaproteobacteria bacterium]
MNDIQNLLDIMTKLRDPASGCPWDAEQTFATIAPYTIEEAYEVAEAIEREDMGELRDELGDLLLQVVFHARMAEEAGHFDFFDVVEAIADKLIRRHPHVFSEGCSARDAEAQQMAWERDKASEREGRPLLSDIPLAMPALKRAQKLQKRAASIGFDWPDSQGARTKVSEELDELDREIAAVRKQVGGSAPSNGDKQFDELGDLLFAVTNLGRKLGFDAEAALRHCNAKFERRFGAVEAGIVATGSSLEQASLEEMDGLWNKAKNAEK